MGLFITSGIRQTFNLRQKHIQNFPLKNYVTLSAFPSRRVYGVLFTPLLEGQWSSSGKAILYIAAHNIPYFPNDPHSCSVMSILVL